MVIIQLSFEGLDYSCLKMNKNCTLKLVKYAERKNEKEAFSKVNKDRSTLITPPVLECHLLHFGYC